MKFIEQFLLKDEVIIVTGAAGGLGRELARLLLDAQATVVMIDIDFAMLEAAAKEIQADTKRIVLQQCDVTSKSSVLAMIDAVDKHCGRIDALVNCAGILGGEKSIFEINESDWDTVLNVNLKGTWLCITEVARYMVAHKTQGRIVNISSVLGSCAQLNRVAYGSSKAGVEHLTRNMAMELADYGIRVNCLAPGFIKTEMVKHMLDSPAAQGWLNAIPMKRAADPSELAGPLLLLTSKASSYMTGTIIKADGGMAFLGLKPIE